MWPAKLPGEGATMVDACKAMCDTMNSLGIAIDGGKDSLSMAARVGNNTVKAPGRVKFRGFIPFKTENRWLLLQNYLENHTVFPEFTDVKNFASPVLFLWYNFFHRRPKKFHTLHMERSPNDYDIHRRRCICEQHVIMVWRWISCNMKHTLITNWLVFHYLLIRSFLYSHQFNSNQLNYLPYYTSANKVVSPTPKHMEPILNFTQF